MTYEKDCFLRAIQMLLEVIGQIASNIDKNNLDKAKLQIESAYELLGKNAYYFYSTTSKEIIDYFKSKEGDYLKKVDSLAQLMCLDAKITNVEETKRSLMEKVKALREYYNTHSRTCSFEAEQKMVIAFKENSFPARFLQRTRLPLQEVFS